MRLARGAGVDGLAAMRSERALLDASPVVLVRPLLQFPKSRLLATVEVRGAGFVEDPSNEDVRYERPRLRRHFPALDAAGISAPALATSARRLGEAQAALSYAEEHFVATLDLNFGNEVFAAFNREAFSQGPAYLRQKVLARLVARYGGASPGPRLSEIEDLTARLERDEKCTATLGGAMISSGHRLVRVWREAGRLDQRDLDLLPGQSQVWDQRFILRWAPAGSGPDTGPITAPATASVTIRPLGAENYSRIAGCLTSAGRPPARAAHALPSFWAGAELLAVPSLAPFAMASGPPLDRAGCELRALALHTGR